MAKRKTEEGMQFYSKSVHGIQTTRKAIALAKKLKLSDMDKTLT